MTHHDDDLLPPDFTRLADLASALDGSPLEETRHLGRMILRALDQARQALDLRDRLIVAEASAADLAVALDNAVTALLLAAAALGKDGVICTVAADKARSALKDRARSTGA